MTTSGTATPSTTGRRRGKQDTNRKTEIDRTTGHHENGTFPPATVEATPRPLPTASVTTSRTMSILQIWAPTLVLIFGGCCSNVYTLESLIQASPSSGPLITAFQFLLVALATAPRHFSYSRGWRNLYLRERAIPLRRWLVYTAYFLSINILNNMAFKYQISVPLHIILRSAGPVTTMAVGRIWGGKRYPAQKIVAVILLFVGVVLAAISDSKSKQAAVQSHAEIDTGNFEPSSSSNSSSKSAISSQAPGFALLASALLLAACMGLYADDMYSTYGRSGAITAETLFYSHAMSLPFFASQTKPLMQELASIATFSGLHDTCTTSRSRDSDRMAFDQPSSNSSLTWSNKFIPSFDSSFLSSAFLSASYLPTPIQIPRPVLLLLLNAATQLLCIVGVNRLSAQSSSLTVSIVLNIRKLASLMLSIWLFGNELPMGVLIGAGVVFVGGGMYALPARSGGGRAKTESPTPIQKEEQKQKIG
ncbi:hypothetical protein A1O1_05088 [Capronia coronata CBS 617.96]|uniref:Sugar phosphate transporter domain-containing protein n=1 Tax=Capronia coronata CBS 617.96 TaxID=1182541 RepID=W9YEQ8_9EURO|nr:uncharacterized protein A1O1_05088 [Capronia coronata CBS 617.96]EXJ88160.1 hypothetical protein A1O1_05088 [Capronia coronata CBS 617.96]